MYDKRAARERDIPHLVPLAKRFAITAFPEITPDTSSIEDTIEAGIMEGNPNAYFQVLTHYGEPVGGFLGSLGSEYWSQDTAVAREIVWFVHRAYRGREALSMLDDFEAWAGARKAKIVHASRLEGVDPHTDRGLDLLYRRRGYTPKIVTYVKYL